MKARLSRAGAGLQVLVYLPDQKELFARICAFFGRTGLSILEAKVHTTRHGYALDTFMVHDPDNRHASYRETIQLRRARARASARRAGGAGAAAPGARQPAPAPFPADTPGPVFPDDKGTHYILEVVAGDRPGLLADITYVLAKAGINVASAKINTLGERAEDVFLIDGARLHDEHALLKLETRLYERLRVP